MLRTSPNQSPLRSTARCRDPRGPVESPRSRRAQRSAAPARSPRRRCHARRRPASPIAFTLAAELGREQTVGWKATARSAPQHSSPCTAVNSVKPTRSANRKVWSWKTMTVGASSWWRLYLRLLQRRRGIIRESPVQPPFEANTLSSCAAISGRSTTTIHPRTRTIRSTLQYVRKVSGSTKPSQATRSTFDRAVDEITLTTAVCCKRSSPPPRLEIVRSRRPSGEHAQPSEPALIGGRLIRPARDGRASVARADTPARKGRQRCRPFVQSRERGSCAMRAGRHFERIALDVSEHAQREACLRSRRGGQLGDRRCLHRPLSALTKGESGREIHTRHHSPGPWGGPASGRALGEKALHRVGGGAPPSSSSGKRQSWSDLTCRNSSRPKRPDRVRSRTA